MAYTCAMKRKLVAVAVPVLAALAGALPTWAHHSFAAAFDMNQPIEVKGTITQVRLENPHSWFFLDVKDANGNVEKWAFEAGTPSGMLRELITPDGKVYGLFGPQENK